MTQVCYIVEDQATRALAQTIWANLQPCMLQISECICLCHERFHMQTVPKALQVYLTAKECRVHQQASKL